MSDNNLEDIMNTVINSERFNELMRDVQIFKNDVVKLGEDNNYINQLDLGYIEKYLYKKDRLPSTTEYMQYRRVIIEHLLDIVKVKYPKNYEILYKEFGQ